MPAFSECFLNAPSVNPQSILTAISLTFPLFAQTSQNRRAEDFWGPGFLLHDLSVVPDGGICPH